MDIINVQNLVTLLKDRCGKIDVSKETDYPTTRGLLMHAALLIEERILNQKPANSIGYFFEHAPFSYSTHVKIVKGSEVLVNGKYGESIDTIMGVLCYREIEYMCLSDYPPSPVTDITEPILVIHVK